MNPQTVAFSTLAQGAPFLDPATGQTLYIKMTNYTDGGNPFNATNVGPVSSAPGSPFNFAGTYQVIPVSATYNF